VQYAESAQDTESAQYSQFTHCTQFVQCVHPTRSSKDCLASSWVANHTAYAWLSSSSSKRIWSGLYAMLVMGCLSRLGPCTLGVQGQVRMVMG